MVSEEYADINLDEHLSDDFIPEEETTEEMLDELTEEEKALLKKIQAKQENQDYLLQAFRELKSRPSDEQIEEFKAQVGEVFLLSLSESENFIFRPLRRLEWRALVQRIQKLDEMKQAEFIVIKACLWPKLDQHSINILTAGAIDTLKEMILQMSNFIPAETAIQLVRKL